MKLPDFQEQINGDGFFDLAPIGQSSWFSKQQKCYDTRHNAPMHLHIPYGKGYRHTCPSCRHVTVLTKWQQSYTTLDCVGSDGTKISLGAHFHTGHLPEQMG